MAHRVSEAVQYWRNTPVLRVSVRYLMYVLTPAWVVPGTADYVMHRRTAPTRSPRQPEHDLLHALPRLTAALVHAGPRTDADGADPHAMLTSHR